MLNGGVDQSGDYSLVILALIPGHQPSPCATPKGDTLILLETRIHETEYKLYPEVLDSLGDVPKIRKS